MNDSSDNPVKPERAPAESEKSSAGGAAIAPEGERLEAVDDIEFLLEEIENKIAPLALA